MEEKLNQLKQILATVDDLGRASSALNWDKDTNMPPGGAENRGQILGTLRKLAHEQFTSDEVGRLLEEIKKELNGTDPDSTTARLIKVTSRDYEKSTKVPAKMVEEKTIITSNAGVAWNKARQESDFSIFQPHLEKVVEISQRYSELFKPYDHIYDPHLDDYEHGMTTSDVKKIFDEIRPKQVELIKSISEKPQLDDSPIYQKFDKDKQIEFGKKVIKEIGYDFDRGRIDAVPHPYQTNLGYGDQRVTYRVDENFFNSYLFAVLHEAGHAMYEQGIAKEFARTPLYGGASLAIHESQSRLWENIIGRSFSFWEYYYSQLQEVFPSQLGNVTLQKFYEAINKVEPSFIRVEADEATYNLHIMLRLEIEIGMIDGSIAIKDLPDFWNSKFEEYLGITPPNDADGVLQDVHWSLGYLGYFSTYALGNIISGQFWKKINEVFPNIDEQIKQGQFSNLFEWLHENIHIHGAKYDPKEILQKLTSKEMDGEPYLNYLNNKFSKLYNL